MPSPPQPPIIGIVLAGGRASRMGGSDKASTLLGGTPLIAHAIRALKPQCAHLIINANGDASRFAAYSLPVIADDVTGFAGPLAGILAGLDAAAARWPEAELAVSVAIDTPFLPADLVARLSAALRAANADIACARTDGVAHPVIALWPIAIRADLRRALVEEDQRKVTRFLSRHKVAYADWPAEPFDPFFNINAPEDLAKAETLFAAQATR